jgi:hypothetical protein
MDRSPRQSATAQPTQWENFGCLNCTGAVSVHCVDCVNSLGTVFINSLANSVATAAPRATLMLREPEEGARAVASVLLCGRFDWEPLRAACSCRDVEAQRPGCC